MQNNRSPLGKIFISYRRDDTRGEAGRLEDSLETYFGGDRVFRDTGGIRGGEDFGEAILKNLEQADAVIILIGRRWLDITDEAGRRRLDDPEDWVSQEVAIALSSGKPVVPVLVEGAQMPRAGELPDALKGLSMRNALSLSDRNWEADIRRLAQILALDIPSATERRLFWVRLAAGLGIGLPLVITAGILTGNHLLGYGLHLNLWHTGITYIGILFSTLLLFANANLVEARSRRYVHAAAVTGALGSLVFLILFWLLPFRHEAPVLLFGSTLTVGMMFFFLLLSGFKAR